MRNATVVLLCLMVPLILLSCRKAPPKSGPGSATAPATGTAAASDKLTLAVIPKGTTHSFWKSVHAGAVKASRELQVEVIWKGAMKENDLAGQISVVENFIVRKVDGIVLAPLHHTALQAKVTNAAKKGIPTVVIDSRLEGRDHVSFVATDNRKGGHMAGQHLAKLLDGKGKVVMMRYLVGSASTENREQGFLDAISEHEGIEVISSDQRGGPDVSKAVSTAERLLHKLRQANGVFCPNESTTFGMLRALQTSGLAGKIKFVGFDSNPKLVQAMADDQIHGLVLQDPINMGYLGVKTMVQHLRGEDIPRRIDTGCGIATPENMESPRIKELLSPDYKRWLGE